MQPVKDIAYNIRWADYKLDICNHYCKNKPRKCNFYNWHTYLDNKFIKQMCENCALREMWGYNYKQRKGFQKWDAQ